MGVPAIKLGHCKAHFFQLQYRQDVVRWQNKESFDLQNRLVMIQQIPIQPVRDFVQKYVRRGATVYAQCNNFSFFLFCRLVFLQFHLVIGGTGTSKKCVSNIINSPCSFFFKLKLNKTYSIINYGSFEFIYFHFLQQIKLLDLFTK